MIQPHLGKLHRLVPLAAGLVAAAEGTAAQVRKIKRERRTSLRYKALGVGPDTPLWNELANTVVATLGPRGDKAKLARLLGVSRQRLHLFLVAKTAHPDAERTLKLLAWLQAANAASPRADSSAISPPAHSCFCQIMGFRRSAVSIKRATRSAHTAQRPCKIRSPAFPCQSNRRSRPPCDTARTRHCTKASGARRAEPTPKATRLVD